MAPLPVIKQVVAHPVNGIARKGLTRAPSRLFVRAFGDITY